MVTLIGVLPILGVAGANLRYADEFIDTGDSLARYIGKACSFDEETPVTTEDGAIPIKDVDVGDKVLAWDETTDSTGYFLVTATWTHEDPVTVLLTIGDEIIETTAEHPFLTANGRWVTAGELAVGDTLRSADGDGGTVDAVAFVAAPQVMYNMTVADAHTYVVGDGEWVVHNSCDVLARRLVSETERRANESRRTLSRRKRGPLLTGVAHPALDEIYFGINHKQPPGNLPKVLQQLDTGYTDAQRSLARVQAGIPGTHSELYALTDAINALEAKLGREISSDELKDFMLTNRYLLAPEIHVINRCDHCRHLTGDVTTIGHQ